MAKLLITTDAHDFIVVDTATKQIVHQQGPTEALDAKHLAGKNRPTFRPFGIDFDNEFRNDTGKDSISSKIPPHLLELIDTIIARETFASRSHFIREAVNNFLTTHKSMHDAFDA